MNNTRGTITVCFYFTVYDLLYLAVSTMHTFHCFVHLLNQIRVLGSFLALAKDRIEALEREVDVLKAQNAALSRTHEEFSKSNKDSAGGSGGGRTEGGGYQCNRILFSVFWTVQLVNLSLRSVVHG